jgi:hypothetical protein
VQQFKGKHQITCLLFNIQHASSGLFGDYLFDNYNMVDMRINRNDFKKRVEDSVAGSFLNEENKTVVIEKVTPGSMKVEKFPNSFQQNVPGYTIYGVFLSSDKFLFSRTVGVPVTAGIAG